MKTNIKKRKFQPIKITIEIENKREFVEFCELLGQCSTSSGPWYNLYDKLSDELDRYQ